MTFYLANIYTSSSIDLFYSANSPSQNKTRPCWFTKVSWDHIDVLSFQCTLDSLLMKINIPFHPLCTSLKGNPLDLDCFLAELTYSLKVTSFVSVPSTRVKIGIQKHGWKEGGESQDFKHHRKFWFWIWADCDRPRSFVIFFSVLKSTKREFWKAVCRWKNRHVQTAICEIKTTPNSFGRELQSWDQVHPRDLTLSISLRRKTFFFAFFRWSSFGWSYRLKCLSTPYVKTWPSEQLCRCYIFSCPDSNSSNKTW